MPRININEHFRVRQPGTDLFWSLSDSHVAGAAATAADNSHTPSTITLRPGVESALILLYESGRLFDSKREYFCEFEGMYDTASEALKLFKLRPSNGPWKRWSIDFSRVGTGRKVWSQQSVAPSDDGRSLMLTDAGFEWRFERMHSDLFEPAFANLVATNKFEPSALPPSGDAKNWELSRLDVDVMFQHALTLTDSSACVQAVASILDHYADTNLHCITIEHFIDRGDRGAAFYFVGRALDQFGYRGNGPVRMASLKAFVQFYWAATDAKYRNRARKLIKYAAESELLDAISPAVTIGNADVVALIVKFRDDAIDPAKMESMVTAATDAFLDALQNGSAHVSARRNIFADVISGRLHNETSVFVPAISGAIIYVSLMYL